GRFETTLRPVRRRAPAHPARRVPSRRDPVSFRLRSWRRVFQRVARRAVFPTPALPTRFRRAGGCARKRRSKRDRALAENASSLNPAARLVVPYFETVVT